MRVFVYLFLTLIGSRFHFDKLLSKLPPVDCGLQT